ncbi:MAG: formate/nitrite transporter family protein [Oscillospiraceae bacterium]|jgi:formate/nitrite transporter|nr:formate/nitrite transporter family protein [Oscillospiraceae bacterium]
MNSPKEVAQNYIAVGEAKAKLPAGKMTVLAILAGMFIALAGAGSTIASVTVASPSLAKLMGALVFPVGLAMTLIAGSELFTGNCLLIIPVLERRIKVSDMLRNWFFVYVGNLIGGFLVAALAVYGGTFSLFDNAAAGAVINTAVAKASLSFGDALLRGILCNFLVCIAVWISFAAKDVVGKVAGLFLPIMLFVLSGYEHSVANMYYISAGLFAAKNPAYAAAATANLTKLSWGSMFGKNLLPVTLGNIIGGVLLVGVAYWFTYLRGGDGAKKAEAKKK